MNAPPNAVALLEAGILVAIRLFMDGSATPSPNPTKNRTNSTAGRVTPRAAVSGVMATAGRRVEAREKKTIPAAMTFFPPNLSARVPPSSWLAR